MLSPKMISKGLFRPRLGRPFFILLLLAAFTTDPAFAAEVKLKSGVVYKDVTVLRRDANEIEVQTQFGKITLPLSSVESVDGVSLAVTPAPAPVSAPSAAAVPPAALASASPAPKSIVDLLATPAPAGTAAAQSTPATSAVTSASVAPSPVQDENTGEDTPPPWPTFTRTWKMEVIIGVFVAFAALWIGALENVRRDLFERRADPRFWSNLSILLPGLGWLFYKTVRKSADAMSKHKAPTTPNEFVARREKSNARARKGFEFLDEDRKAVLLKNDSEISGIDNARDVLEEALLERASDVHIEPTEEEYGVRFRVDGFMQSRMSFPKADGQRLVSALKTLAQIDVAEKRKAQDGRFRVRTGESDVDFRVATANSIFGEKLVIRILDRKAGVLGLGDLGMPQTMMEQFSRVIHSRNGMILATGPTGSGKTSTLYSALHQIDSKKLNIMTIEDPVEYELTGATQIPVNVKAGITYESGLRSLLRQDPDVIFVGEMRDAEAAQIALRAALTGHLVFSSLHTRDAIGTIIRLEEMGIERHLLSSSLLVLIAQRLVRVLCPACRESYDSAGNELDEIGLQMPAGATIYRPKGCKKCNDTGYVGRTGLFEMVVFDDAMRSAVHNGAQESELAQLARASGFRTLREEGADKILQGVTSVEEVLQAS